MMNKENNRWKSRYIREGGRSFHKSKGRYINPYEQSSTAFNDFERGWSQALKRSPEQLLREYQTAENAPIRQSTVLPKLVSDRKKKEMPEDTYKSLASRARKRLLNNPSYQPTDFAWRTHVYYVRIEAYEMPLWKIGITSNNIRSRYCVADRRIIVEIKSWQYATREEAEAIEREVLMEFADDLYKGGPVLRSGGNSELFTLDVLRLDNQDDILRGREKRGKLDRKSLIQQPLRVDQRPFLRRTL